MAAKQRRVSKVKSLCNKKNIRLTTKMILILTKPSINTYYNYKKKGSGSYICLNWVIYQFIK